MKKLQIPFLSGLTGNQLKIIAVITMTIDHIGYYLFPGMRILRIIGRLAFPIFAYTFAEGCRYTKNRTRHFLVLCLFAVLCQVVYTFATQSLYQNILVTLALSALMIYSLDFAQKNKGFLSYILALAVLFAIFFVSYILPWRYPHKDFAIDYGFWGIMLPVLVYIGKSKGEKLFLLSLGLLFMAPTIGTIQFYSVFAIPLIALYNGNRGKWKMKNFFYIYYPLHLVIIYLVSIFVM